VAARVVPIDAERVHVTLGSAGKCQARVSRMHGVIDVQGLIWIGGARHSVTGLVEQSRNAHGSMQTILLNPNWTGFDPKKLADNRGQTWGRPTRLSARNRRDSLLLLRRRPVVDHQANGPIALAHHIGRVAKDCEAQSIQRDAALIASLDLENHREIAMAFR